MALNFPTNFFISTALPIDDRLKFADLTQRDALDLDVRYEGMIVYVTSEQTNFQLIGGITNGDWKELSGSGGGSGGGGSIWAATPGNEAFVSNEHGVRGYEFAFNGAQSIEKLYRVPASYKAGTQLFIEFPFYVRTTMLDVIKMELTSVLVTAAITSDTNSHVDDLEVDGAVTTTLQNRIYSASLEITDADGKINSIDILPGNFIKLKLSRVAVTGGFAEYENSFVIINEMIKEP